MFRKKSLTALMNEASQEGQHTLKRTLGAPALIALGIGAIIGAGLFVRTASAAAEDAGPAVVLSFVIAAVGCALAGLCYAEFASCIPIAGSAYTYSYATMGELLAWIIGWDLVLEYALGAATVSIAWSEYLNSLLVDLGASPIPYQWCHTFLMVSDDGVRGIINLPAIFIIVALSLLLIRGTQESALVNGIVVVVKVAIVIAFIAIGWGFINSMNHDPFIPGESTYKDSLGNEKTFTGGWMGILGGAGTVFFAFIGFDAVSTAAQEAKNPKRDMPIGILGSLAICTVLYILFAWVLTGVANYKEFQGEGREASVAYAIIHHMPGWGNLSTFITVAILAGFSSVILVMLLGQSRVFYSMSKDGLVPPVFSQLHPKFRTPYKSNLILMAFIAIFSGFVPGDIVGDMTSIGTLFAFVLVSFGVIILRQEKGIRAAFRTPLVPIVPLLGAGVCLAMIYGLGWENWARLGAWMIIGFLIYFLYGKPRVDAREDAKNGGNS